MLNFILLFGGLKISFIFVLPFKQSNLLIEQNTAFRKLYFL